MWHCLALSQFPGRVVFQHAHVLGLHTMACEIFLFYFDVYIVHTRSTTKFPHISSAILNDVIDLLKSNYQNIERHPEEYIIHMFLYICIYQYMLYVYICIYVYMYMLELKFLHVSKRGLRCHFPLSFVRQDLIMCANLPQCGRPRAFYCHRNDRSYLWKSF